MLSFVRRAPNILVIESGYIRELEKGLIHLFHAEKLDINSALTKADEHCTIMFIVDEMKPVLHFSDALSILMVPLHTEILLTNIINLQKPYWISRSRLAPKIILMRAFGKIENVLGKIHDNYYAEEGAILDILDKHSTGTLISLTKRPLHQVISLNDIYEKSLFIDKDYQNVIRNFRIHALEYLNAGIDNKDWYELEIKIYDAYGKYKLHYKRLLHIIECLEFGLVLGESWGKDVLSMFRSVEIYRVRLFTFFDPQYIKRILLGLEYINNGTRIVDYDVFYKGKKLHWSDLKNREYKQKTALSQFMREKILTQLNDTEAEQLLELENKILQTRY